VPSLRELGEIEVLRRLTAERHPGSGVVLGPGDDAALLETEPARTLVATTDSFVEGAHWLPQWSDPERVGARLAAANLSDLAAMAARPRWALLAIGARPESDVEALLAMQRGLQAALARLGATLVGGNLTSVAGAQWVTLTLLGDVPGERAWRRSGARPGDLVAVTGHPGRAGAGLALARRLGERARAPEWHPLLSAWLEPEPRVAAALALAEVDGVTAAIDVSDGLAGDLARLCEASGHGVRLAADGWSPDAELERAASVLGTRADALRLGPSDDYELLLAVDPARRGACEAVAKANGVPLAFIGHFAGRPDERVMVDAAGALRPIEVVGYDAFRDRAGG
jgi:thiamine-monophosphate kinase